MTLFAVLSACLFVETASVLLPSTATLNVSTSLQSSFDSLLNEMPREKFHVEEHGDKVCMADKCSGNMDKLSMLQQPPHEMDAKTLDAAKNSLADVLKENPKSTPMQIAVKLKQKWMNSGVYKTFDNLAAKEVNMTAMKGNGTDANTGYKINLDSGFAGVAVTVSGEGNKQFGPGFSVVAFVNHGFNSQGTRTCLGTRAGVTVGHPGNGGSGSFIGGIYEWEFVPGAAWFAGLGLDSLGLQLSTKAAHAEELIGFVVPLKLVGCAQEGPCALQSPYPTKAFNGMLLNNVNLDVIMGYTWCF